MENETHALRLGVLASGRGSNLEALLEAHDQGRLAARVAIVLSDRPDAPALERARRRGIPALVIDPETTRARLRPEIEERYVAALRDAGVEWVVLAGFFRIIGAVLLENYPDRILNIHPSLLPAFPGLHAQRQALEYGVRIAGCTVHLVNAEIDQGSILAQAAVPVHDEDDEEALAARILEQEHRLLVETVARLAHARIRREGRRVLWEETSPGTARQNGGD